jgi:hypothetical protein
MVSHPNGPGFDHFCRSALVEPDRWCGDTNLDYRLVRSNNRRSGDHFWFSLTQLTEIGNPLISGKRLESHHSNGRAVFRAVEAYRAVRKLFARLNLLTAGLLKKMRPEAINWPITLRRWNMTVPISRLDFAMVKQKTIFASTTL